MTTPPNGQPVTAHDLNPGDHISVTFSGMIDADGDLEFANGYLSKAELRHAAAIFRHPPLAEGDQVRINASVAQPGVIQAIRGVNAWVEWADGEEAIESLSDLVRDEPAPAPS